MPDTRELPVVMGRWFQQLILDSQSTNPIGHSFSITTTSTSQTGGLKIFDFEEKSEIIEKIAGALEDSFRAGSPREIEEDEERALVLADGDYMLFAELAYNEDYRIDVRGLAARMFVAQAGSYRKEKAALYYDTFKNHESPLIRLGVVLGLEELGDFQELMNFIDDPDEEVRETAAEAIAEAEGE